MQSYQHYNANNSENILIGVTLNKMKTIKLPIAANELIPHRSPMLLIDELSTWSEAEMKGSALIKKDNPFLNSSGILDSNGLVEIMAQTVAAGNGYHAKILGEPIKTGFLVGLSELEFFDCVSLGDSLSTEIIQESKVGKFSIVKGNVIQSGRCITSGIIKIFELEGQPEYLAPSAKEKQNRSTQSYNGLQGIDYSSVSKELLKNLDGLEINNSKNTALCEFKVNEDFIGFQGHFPGFSILPGVIMIDMARILTEALTDERIKITCIDKAKFSKQVHPSSILSGEVKITEQGDDIKVIAKLKNNGEMTSSFSFNAIIES